MTAYNLLIKIDPLGFRKLEAEGMKLCFATSIVSGGKSRRKIDALITGMYN